MQYQIIVFLSSYGTIMIKGIQSFRTKEGGRTADKRWEYGIFEKQQDIDYFQKLDNDTLFNEETGFKK